MAKSAEKVIADFTQKLLKEIGVKAEVAVKEEKEAVNVTISGDNLGALIGFHGQTLEGLQLILNLVFNKQSKEEEWKRVVLDIGNWRAERLSTLEELVERAVAELRGQALARVNLPTMSASQRREIHLIVTQRYPELMTESEGEEPNRRVVLYLSK